MPHNVRIQTIYVTTGNPETVDDITPYAPAQLGGRVTLKQPGPPGSPGVEHYRDKTYQYVNTDSSMTVAPYPGAVAYWFDKVGYIVTTSIARGRGRVAGLFQNFLPRGHYGFIQTQGPATVKYIDVVTAEPTIAGQWVIPGNVDAKADCLAIGAALIYPYLGRSWGTRNPASEGIVDLDVMETP